MLADYAEVEPQYEIAVEQFLRDELEYVVVETFDHARAGIAILRDEVGGRATFFVDSLRTLQLSANEPVVPFAADPAVISRLDQLLAISRSAGACGQAVFAAPANGLSGRRRRREPNASPQAIPAYSFLTPDGTCYQGRAVTGGRPAEAGPLVMKREMRTLEAEIRQSEEQLAAAQASLDELQAALRAVRARPGDIWPPRKSKPARRS